MIKVKYILVIIILTTIIYSCGDDDSTDSFDHAAQAVIDNDSLVSFLGKHYYNTAVDSVKPLVSGQTALLDDPNLKIQSVTENDIDYKLYYYVKNVGNPMPVKGFPTVMDSVLTKYSGHLIINTDSIASVSFDADTKWWVLSSVIRGWSYGFTHFKGGQNISAQNINNPVNFIEGGKGVLFIPSGLAYGNNGNGTISGNAILMFYIELWDIIEDTDLDVDSIPSILEDVDGDGDPRNDDTDGDNIPNYFDVDDDGDGKATIEEDRDGDGDPTNDFNDPDNPNLPDYLNPNIFG